MHVHTKIISEEDMKSEEETWEQLKSGGSDADAGLVYKYLKKLSLKRDDFIGFPHTKVPIF